MLDVPRNARASLGDVIQRFPLFPEPHCALVCDRAVVRDHTDRAMGGEGFAHTVAHKDWICCLV